MKSLKTAQRRGGYWEDCQKAIREIEGMNLQISQNKESFFEGRIAARLDSLLLTDKFFDQKKVHDFLKRVPLFGWNNKPDLTIGTDGTAVEVKRVWSGKMVREALSQAIFYRTHYRFAIVVLIDQTENCIVHKLVNSEGSMEAQMVKDFEELNIFIVTKRGQ